MTFNLRQLPQPPAGFGRCARCAYREVGPAALCFACASKTMEAVARHSCLVCDHPLSAPDASCGNPVCNWPDRFFNYNYAISMKTGVLERAIKAYKYENIKGWGHIFRRVVIGYLEERPGEFDGYDLLIPSPTYVGTEEGARTWDHTAFILQMTAEEASSLPLRVHTAPPLIAKDCATQRLTGLTWKQRHAVATGEIRSALTVPDARLTAGKKILVFDDVFTDGLNLNEVARALRLLGGAAEVSGLTLARASYRGSG